MKRQLSLIALSIAMTLIFTSMVSTPVSASSFFTNDVVILKLGDDAAVNTAVDMITSRVHGRDVKVLDFVPGRMTLEMMRYTNNLIFVGHGSEDGAQTRAGLYTWEDFARVVRSFSAGNVILLQCNSNEADDHLGSGRYITFPKIDSRLGAVITAGFINSQTEEFDFNQLYMEVMAVSMALARKQIAPLPLDVAGIVVKNLHTNEAIENAWDIMWWAVDTALTVGASDLITSKLKVSETVKIWLKSAIEAFIPYIKTLVEFFLGKMNLETFILKTFSTVLGFFFGGAQGHADADGDTDLVKAWEGVKGLVQVIFDAADLFDGLERWIYLINVVSVFTTGALSFVASPWAKVAIFGIKVIELGLNILPKLIADYDDCDDIPKDTDANDKSCIVPGPDDLNAPTVSVSSTNYVNEETEITIKSVFSSNPDYVAPVHYVVNWGDGTTVETDGESTTPLTLTHRYTGETSYTVKVSAKAKGASVAPKTTSRTLTTSSRAAPTMATGYTGIYCPAYVERTYNFKGIQCTLPLISHQDGAGIPVEVEVDWGDGSPHEKVIVKSGDTRGVVYHTYMQSDIYRVKVRARALASMDVDSSYTAWQSSGIINVVDLLTPYQPAFTGGSTKVTQYQSNTWYFRASLPGYTTPQTFDGDEPVLEYLVTFGDGTTETYYEYPEKDIAVTHSFSSHGSNSISVKARIAGIESQWSLVRVVSVDVQPAPAPSNLRMTGGRTYVYRTLTYTWTFSSTSSVYSKLDYYVSFGDGSSRSYTGYSGQSVVVSHAYSNSGTYTMAVKSRVQGSYLWTPYLYLSIHVSPGYAPSTPALMSGSTYIKENYNYKWGFRSTDHLGLGDTLKYSISWGDGSSTTVYGKAGTTVYASHRYHAGKYTMKIRAIVHGVSGAIWSSYLYLSITVKSVSPPPPPIYSPGPPRGGVF